MLLKRTVVRTLRDFPPLETATTALERLKIFVDNLGLA